MCLSVCVLILLFCEIVFNAEVSSDGLLIFFNFLNILRNSDDQIQQVSASYNIYRAVRLLYGIIQAAG